jgi:NAD(P)-dependent dehydrogenase (short-subunit alcohol dehydrogenase family)
MDSNSGPEVVVVTGASAGVGRAVARAFARPGARIALLARGRAGLEGARSDVEEANATALAIPTDVADPGQVEAAAETIERELGPIGIWINNAMVSVFSRFAEMTPEEYRRVTEVTYLGYVHGTMSALRRMLPRDRGTIVQVGSALAYRGIPLQSAYCGAKHAVQGFTESLRTELLHDRSRVRVTMVQLPALNTPQFIWVRSRLEHRAQPVPPIYEPEVAAKAIVWAARHHRRELEVGWPTVVSVWGDKIASGLGDRWLARAGFSSQEYDGPEDAGRPDNLWQPVDDDHDFGAHGPFDGRARGISPQLWANTHSMWLVAGAGIVGLGLAALLRSRR